MSATSADMHASHKSSTPWLRLWNVSRNKALGLSSIFIRVVGNTTVNERNAS